MARPNDCLIEGRHWVPHDKPGEITNCERCGRLLQHIGNSKYVAGVDPTPPALPERRAGTGCFLVFVETNGKITAQKWWMDKGNVVGGHRNHVILAQYLLAADQERMTIKMLVKEYAPPEATGRQQ